MSFLKRFVKPSIVDENKFYIIDQIIRTAGKNRHYLLHGVSDGLFNLIRKTDWDYRRSEVKPSDVTIFFKDEERIIELECSIEQLHLIWDKVRKEKE